MTAQREHEGRIAVITGGGRGFGKAFGHALAERGAHVALADIDAQAGERAVAEIIATGGDATAYECDVNDETQVAEMIADLAERHGGVDVLINNAGLHSQTFNEPMANSGIDKLRTLFDVNLMGTIICTLAAAPTMKGRPGASIINISSAAADGCQTAYGISKLAVRGVTVTSARELGADGIRVNAIAPGLIFTDTIRAELPASVVDVVKATQVIDRDGDEQDVVDAMLFLVSDRAKFITAETLRVGGGLSIHV
jgi:3-oxoacyl-[acyl-carrier protein] reductase